VHLPSRAEHLKSASIPQSLDKGAGISLIHKECQRKAGQNKGKELRQIKLTLQ